MYGRPAGVHTDFPYAFFRILTLASCRCSHSCLPVRISATLGGIIVLPEREICTRQPGDVQRWSQSSTQYIEVVWIRKSKTFPAFAILWIVNRFVSEWALPPRPTSNRRRRIFMLHQFVSSDSLFIPPSSNSSTVRSRTVTRPPCVRLAQTKWKRPSP